MKTPLFMLWTACFTLIACVSASTAWSSSFERRWQHVSETSAIIYWQLDDIGESAISRLVYGETQNLEQQTEWTRKPRWSHLHRMINLEPGKTYYYRMEVVDTLTKFQSRSEICQITAEAKAEAVRIPQDVAGPPYILDKKDTYYILTEDIISDYDAIRITAAGVTLDLDGHTVTFGDNTSQQVFGVRLSGRGKATLCNGYIVQGKRSADYSCAIRSEGRPYPTEIYGITTDVHLKCAYPLNYHTQASDVSIHHNHFFSRVTELESRHYPGNSLLRINISGGKIHIHDNLLTEGCHWGIKLINEGPNVEIDYNDIRHHQQYVNGYAIVPSAGANVHHNRITSTGRGAHLSREGIDFHDNYFDLKGHMHLSDLPAGTRPFQHRLIELHGIKFEGSDAKNCKVYNNYVRIVQKLPSDSDGVGDPEDKIENGVYLRSMASLLSGSSLVDDSQKWEQDRWRYYYVKYSPDLPPARIEGNTQNTLTADFQSASPGEYTIYMKWQYVPPTPLNIACYDPNAQNEVYGNTFIAITEYKDDEIRHGDYGDTGNWASAIMFIGMDQGHAQYGKYSIYVHGNEFFSNDLFLNSSGEVNMTVRIENNIFELLNKPHLVQRDSRFRAVGQALADSVNSGNNTFSSGQQQGNLDINNDGELSVADVIFFLLLGHNEPDNPILDWNRDGKYEISDAIALLIEIRNASSRSNLISLQNPATSRADAGLLSSDGYTILLRHGMDGL